MGRIFRFLKARDWIYIAVSVVFIVAQVYLDLKLPEYMKRITELVVAPGGTMPEIWGNGGYMLLCSLGSLASSIVVGFFAARVAAGFSRNVREAVFDKVEAFSMEEINRFSTASLITRSTNDITQLQMVVALGMQVLIKAPIMAVWAICKIAGKAWQWTAMTGGAVALMLIMLAVVVVFALPKFKKIQRLTDNLNRVTRENLTGVRVVRAYNAEGYQEEKFRRANDELTANNLYAMRMMVILQPGMSIIMNALSMGIFILGAFLIDAAQLTEKVTLFGDMMVFSAYAMQVVMAFMMLTIIFVILPRASVSAKRINEVLDAVPKIVDGPGAEAAGEDAPCGEVEFQNVSFRYPDAADAVLSNISFKAKKGETVAFIGATGSGKSTLVNLVPRFYDATEGRVLVDGRDVRDYKLEELHNKLGYVPQRAVLFTGTVASNVAYGENGKPRPDEERIREALEVAQAEDFVENMEEGSQSRIAQGGANVSGGQKQRLAIARAVCRQPEIYIFDDSFSALDYKTDRSLRKALKEYTKDATCLIVGQRIGTIKDADRIVVLDEGGMVGVGTHEELMKNCPVYQEIAYSQLSKEELSR